MLRHIVIRYTAYLYAGTYKNVKFITQKTGQTYIGTTYPQGEVDNQPTPGTKVHWDTPYRWLRGWMVYGIRSVGGSVWGLEI